MSVLRDGLQQTVTAWESLGHPALIERFVLRNGKAYRPRARIGERGEPKQCFSNATHYVLRVQRPKTKYVEGFFYRPGLIPIHHAWVTTNGHDAMDPTLDSAGNEYLGFAFDTPILRDELVKSGYYGLFDSGRGVNFDLMFRLDPELEKIAQDVRKNARITA